MFGILSTKEFDIRKVTVADIFEHTDTGVLEQN